MPTFGYTFPEGYNMEHSFIMFLEILIDNAIHKEEQEMFLSIFKDEY